MSKNLFLRIAAASALASTLGAAPAWATPLLGTAQSFSVLGASTVTNTGATTLWGDLGAHPGSAITGGGTVILGGMLHQNDAVAQQAQHDAVTAYKVLAERPVSRDLTGQDLGGLTLTSGVYGFASSAQLTGALRLDYQNQADAVFIFQIMSALTTASSSTVSFLNGGAAPACSGRSAARPRWAPGRCLPAACWPTRASPWIPAPASCAAGRLRCMRL